MLDLLEILYTALQSPIGVVIRVSDFQLAQQRLYKARRDAMDPELACLQFRRSPFDPLEIWIVKGTKNESEEHREKDQAAHLDPR